MRRFLSTAVPKTKAKALRPSATTATTPAPSTTPSRLVSPAYPSTVLNRMEEFYDSVLAEDLMILSYDHTFTNPQSPLRRAIERVRHSDENRAWMELERHVRRERVPLAMEHRDLAKPEKSSSKKAATIQRKNAVAESSKRPQNDYKQWLDPPAPRPEVLASRGNAYERIPHLKDISLYMHMQDAVTHNRKVLLNGLLALQLVTGQQGQLQLAAYSSSRWKIRKGMPVGVGVTLEDPRVVYNFLERLVEVVMPKLRDFAGFSQLAGSEDGSGRSVRLRFDAEAWQAFPEIEQAYLKFPQMGSTGALQPFEICFGTTASSDEEARLLLSGFRIPFTLEEKPPAVEDVPSYEQELVHEV